MFGDASILRWGVGLLGRFMTLLMFLFPRVCVRGPRGRALYQAGCKPLRPIVCYYYLPEGGFRALPTLPLWKDKPRAQLPFSLLTARAMVRVARSVK